MARAEGVRGEPHHGDATVALEDAQAVEGGIREPAAIDGRVAAHAILARIVEGSVGEGNGAAVHALAFSAWSKSHKISSISSRPTERRIRSSLMPPASFSSLVN